MHTIEAFLIHASSLVPLPECIKGGTRLPPSATHTVKSKLALPMQPTAKAGAVVMANYLLLPEFKPHSKWRPINTIYGLYWGRGFKIPSIYLN